MGHVKPTSGCFVNAFLTFILDGKSIIFPRLFKAVNGLLSLDWGVSCDVGY